MARRYARDSSEVEDLAQETLLRAWRNQGKLRDPRQWTAWLARIARNEALRALESKRPMPVDEMEERGEEDHRLGDLVERSEVEVALTWLSETDREILTLRYVEDLTQPVIADRLGIPEGTAKVRLSRARKRLAEKLRQ